MKGELDKQFNKRIFGTSPRSLWEDIFNLLFLFVVAVLIILVAFGQVYTGANVEGPSMMPTFNKDYYSHPEKEDVVYYRATDSYDYGDIVVAHVVENGVEKDIIKRVVGLPGDYIEIRMGSDGNYYLYRNAVKVDEPYILSYEGMAHSDVWFNSLTKGMGHLTVGARELFIMGDNRGDSKDSTKYGCFDYDQILGVVDYVVDSEESPVISMFLQLFFPLFKEKTIV